MHAEPNARQFYLSSLAPSILLRPRIASPLLIAFSRRSKGSCGQWYRQDEAFHPFARISCRMNTLAIRNPRSTVSDLLPTRGYRPSTWGIGFGRGSGALSFAARGCTARVRRRRRAAPQPRGRLEDRILPFCPACRTDADVAAFAPLRWPPFDEQSISCASTVFLVNDNGGRFPSHEQKWWPRLCPCLFRDRLWGVSAPSCTVTGRRRGLHRTSTAGTSTPGGTRGAESAVLPRGELAGTSFLDVRRRRIPSPGIGRTNQAATT